MKKLLLAIGIAAFMMTSCCDKQENKEQKDCCKGKQEQCDKHEMPAPCPEMMAHIDIMLNALANWEDLDEAQRTDLIEMAKKHVEMTNAMKAECQKHEGCKHEGKCEGKHGEGHKCEGNHEGCKKHEGCKHEGNCKHEEGKKCEGNHEGCKNHEGGCKHGDK